MTIEELQASKDLPVWDDARTLLHYVHPIPRDAKTSRALRRGIPAEQLYRLGRLSAQGVRNRMSVRSSTRLITLSSTAHRYSRRAAAISVRSRKVRVNGETVRNFAITSTLSRSSIRVISIWVGAHFKEFSQYAHLETGSVSACGLKVGDAVKTGQLIGKVGKSGWTDRDHLHFIVFSDDDYEWIGMSNPFGFKSFKISFI